MAPNHMLVWLMVAAGPAQRAATAPASAPAERQWGPSMMGLSLAAVPVGTWTFGGEMKVSLAIRNTGLAAITLPPRNQVFAYLLVAQGKAVFYSDKIFPTKDAANWPEKLAPEQTIDLGSADASKLLAFPYAQGLKLIDGYPASAGPDATQPAAGKLAEALAAGPVKVKCMVYLDRRGERPLTLEGRSLSWNVGAGEFARLSPQHQERVLADLAARMVKDEFAAQAACAEAARIGPPAAPTVLAVLTNERAPEFARMWSATALADIGGADAVAALTDCLGDSAPGVRHVAAYHGLKLKDAKFEAALNKAALAAKDPMVTAWAILGYLKFRQSVPPALLAAGPDSDQWRVRMAVVETIARARPDPTHLPILYRLLKDPNDQIRAKAVQAVQTVGDKSRPTIDALLAGLAVEGDGGRAAITAVLASLTGNDWRYNPQASPQARQETLDRWQEWWHRNKGNWGK